MYLELRYPVWSHVCFARDMGEGVGDGEGVGRGGGGKKKGGRGKKGGVRAGL